MILILSGVHHKMQDSAQYAANAQLASALLPQWDEVKASYQKLL